MVNVNRQKEKTPMPELDPDIRRQNFEEVSLGYTEEDATNEAQRCIHCPQAPCVLGCPVGVPISPFIRKVGEGDFAQAYAIIKDTNTLPAICGRVCPQETQCEGLCTRGKNGEPLGIGYLERFVADWALDHPQEAAEALARYQEEELSSELKIRCDVTSRKVAVVGSGPASLTCAGELAKAGVSVTIYESLHKPGGVLIYGIPEFRLPKDLVAREIAVIESRGVTIEVNSVIGKLYDVKELMEEKGFDAVFVGTGAGLPHELGIEGEMLNGATSASEFLTRVNLMKAYKFPEYATPVYAGKHCVVVGGGNVAMDAARTARRLGAEVKVVYRRSKEEMPARAEEVHHAEEEGISFQMLTNPVRALGDEDGWVTGVECMKMELGKPDASGRRSPLEIEGSNFVIDIDMLIIAIGSKPNPQISLSTPGLSVTSRGLIAAHDETMSTSIPGVFAGGDAVLGSATVIKAMSAGKRAAQGIVDFLCKTI